MLPRSKQFSAEQRLRFGQQTVPDCAEVKPLFVGTWFGRCFGVSRVSCVKNEFISGAVTWDYGKTSRPVSSKLELSDPNDNNYRIKNDTWI